MMVANECECNCLNSLVMQLSKGKCGMCDGGQGRRLDPVSEHRGGGLEWTVSAE